MIIIEAQKSSEEEYEADYDCQCSYDTDRHVLSNGQWSMTMYFMLVYFGTSVASNTDDDLKICERQVEV